MQRLIAKFVIGGLAIAFGISSFAQAQNFPEVALFAYGISIFAIMLGLWIWFGRLALRWYRRRSI